MDFNDGIDSVDLASSQGNGKVRFSSSERLQCGGWRLFNRVLFDFE